MNRESEEAERQEQRRLGALEDLDILDTVPETAFDDFVTVAAALCGTPIALVSLVDRDRQWFKARVGLDLEETPIEQAVCAHAIRQRDIFVISDLTTDPRTADNPLVTNENGIRFYAGAPLITAADIAIGTLCVIDVVPRPEGLNETQKTGLAALARQVVAALEMRSMASERTSRAVRQRIADAASRDGLLSVRATEQAARIGTFELDLATSIMDVTPQFCRLFGMPIRPSYPASVIEQTLLPDTRAMHSTPDTRINGSAELDVEYRIRRANDGAVRWIARRAAFERDGDGKPVQMYGTVHDVTERRLAGERTAGLLQLGDRLRDADDLQTIVDIASDILGRTLDVDRAGFAELDTAGQIVLSHNWLSAGAPSIAGTRTALDFAETLAHIATGQGLAIADIEDEPDAPDPSSYESIGVRAMIMTPLRGRGEFGGFFYVHQETPRAWSEREVAFVRNVADRVHAALSKVRAESDRRLMSQELGHRLKNMLSLVQAIARQTLKPVAEQHYVLAFDQRLVALASAHDALIDRNWTGAELSAVISRILHSLGQAERVSVAGPEVGLGARSTQTLSLLVHELTTNAMKYGALSVEGGRIDLAWKVEGSRGAETVRLEWRESGGPPVAPPARKGFGSRLISLGLTGHGESSVSYPPAGLEATFTAPLTRLASE